MYKTQLIPEYLPEGYECAAQFFKTIKMPEQGHEGFNIGVEPFKEITWSRNLTVSKDLYGLSNGG